MKIGKSGIVLASCLAALPVLAGTWTIQGSVFHGSASGTSTPTTISSNGVNGEDISNGSYAFLSGTTSISGMNSTISHPGEYSAEAIATTTDAYIVYTLAYIPDNKNDVPGTTVTVCLTLNYQLSVSGITSTISATIDAMASAAGDGRAFPPLAASASGAMASLEADPVNKTIRLVKVLPVTDKTATLVVDLETQTAVAHTPLQDGGEVGGGDSPGAEVSAIASLTPGIEFLSIVLTVPAQGVYPWLNPTFSDDNKFKFNSSSPGVLENPAWQAMVVGGSPSAFLPYTTFTSFAVSGSSVTSDSISISGQTIRQQFTYTGLPSSNSSFGDKEVVMTCTSPVSTTQKAYVRVFFPKNATNHPTPDAPYYGSHTPTPNWFYYWYQTPAYYGQCKYGGPSGLGAGQTVFDSASSTWIAKIYDDASGGPGSTFYGSPTGIDFFAHVCRHEERHRLDLTAFWGNANRISSEDTDLDFIPNDYNGYAEESLTPQAHQLNFPLEHYEDNDPDSVTDDVAYGPNPNAQVNDLEDYCRHRQATWINGTASSIDWAKPGKQW